MNWHQSVSEHAERWSSAMHVRNASLPVPLHYGAQRSTDTCGWKMTDGGGPPASRARDAGPALSITATPPPTVSGSRERRSDAGPAAKKEPDVTQTDWPLRSYLELGALPDAVPCARLHVKQVAWEWGLEDLGDALELVTSELVTNAVHISRESGLPSVRLWLRANQEHVVIQVWDGDHRLPTPQETDLEAEGGRGLLLVKSLSENWGAYRPEDRSGKVVWAAMRAASSARL